MVKKEQKTAKSLWSDDHPWYKNDAGFIKPWIMITGYFGFVVIYQIIVMWAWYAFPWLDTFLLRYSLSNGDSTSIYSICIAFIAYSIAVTSSESKDAKTMREAAALMSAVMVELKDTEKKLAEKEGREPRSMEQISKDVAEGLSRNIYNVIQKEEEIKMWLDRMEKFMPIFDAMASTIENIDEKKLGLCIGQLIGEFINKENAPDTVTDVELTKMFVKMLDDKGYKIVKKGGKTNETNSDAKPATTTTSS